MNLHGLAFCLALDCTSNFGMTPFYSFSATDASLIRRICAMNPVQQRMEDSDLKRLRGKTAIDAAHEGLSGDDEGRLDSAISEMYSVDNEEAADIHANYHIDRIFASLVHRAKENGMRKDTIAKRLGNLDFTRVGSQVAKGKLAEAAALELLFRELSKAESNGNSDDRYIQFYG
jgi:hypothetical protein